jgi:hypothetical protein
MTGSRNQAFIFMALGFTIWASALAVLYATQGIGCELGWQRHSVGPLSVLRWLLIMLWAVHMAVLARLFLICRRALAIVPASEAPYLFLWRAATTLTVASIVATAWIGLALLAPSMCVA